MDERKHVENEQPIWQPILRLSDEFRRLNLNVLRRREPDVYSQLESHEPELERVEVQVFGLDRIRARIDAGEPWELIPSLDKQEAFRARVGNLLRQQPQLEIIAGVEFGAELDRIDEAARTALRLPFVLFAKDPLRILLALSTHNRSMLLESGTLVWALGEPLLDRLAETFETHALYTVENDRIETTFGIATSEDEASQSLYVEALRGLLPKMTPWREELMQAIQRFHEHQRNPSGSPKCVWSSSGVDHYTATPILKALHRGLAEHGLESRFIELPSSRTDDTVQHRSLMSARPDMILFLNNPTRLHVGQGKFDRATWVTDDPTFRSYRNVAPTYDAQELVLYADKAYETVLGEQGAKRRAHMPEFALLNGEGTFRPELAYPLVYVGMVNNMEAQFERLNARDRELTEEVHALTRESGLGTMGAARIWAERDIPPSLLEQANAICATHGKRFDDGPVTLSYVTYLWDTFRRRWETARALLPLGLHIYGGPDWQPLLGDEYADRYHGSVPYGELADIYRSARIAVNVHSLQLPTALNIRDYDVLMAGGCLLTDTVEEMGKETLQPGHDLVAAETPEAFAERARELLGDDDRRASLGSQGQTTVMARHLPSHRAELILDALGKL